MKHSIKALALSICLTFYQIVNSFLKFFNMTYILFLSFLVLLHQMIAISQISFVLLNRIFKQSNLIGNVFNDLIFYFYSLLQLSILLLKLLDMSCILVLAL